MSSDYTQHLLVDSTPANRPAKKSCFQRFCCCCTTKNMITLAVFLAILAGCVTGTYYITDKIAKDKYYRPRAPQFGCGSNFTLAQNAWFFGQKHLSFGPGSTEVYRFAFSFSSDAADALEWQDKNEVALGNLFVCGDASGMTNVDPFNCSNTAIYDSERCAVAWQASACTLRVATKQTDMHIDWIAFDAVRNLLNVSFTSNTPGAAGVISLKRVPDDAARPIACPANATSV